MKLKYSPDAREALQKIKLEISASRGSVSADRVISNITKTIRGLQDNPLKGPSVENMLGIPSPYRFLHTGYVYVFYRLENTTVFITDIFSERENFMWKMFGINLRTSDSIDFWGE